MTLKTPITDVDAIRGLASRALAGLARSESVRQIISKLPLFNSGQLQSMYIYNLSYIYYLSYFLILVIGIET